MSGYMGRGVDGGGLPGGSGKWLIMQYAAGRILTIALPVSFPGRPAFTPSRRSWLAWSRVASGTRCGGWERGGSEGAG